MGKSTPCWPAPCTVRQGWPTGSRIWRLASQVATLGADLPRDRDNLTEKVRELRRVGKAGPLREAQSTVKRLRARLPRLPVVAACWGRPDEVDAACGEMLEAGATDVAVTLREARDRIVQYRLLHGAEAPSRAA